MKNILITIIAVLNSIYMQAQSPSPAVQNKDDLSQLRILNRQFIANFILQDTNAHNKIIHRDFMCIEGSGQVINRVQYMKDWATGYARSGYLTFDYTDECIRVFYDMALVISKTVFTKEVGGKTIEGNSIYTDTYIRENGKWLCVQAHITPIK